MFELNEQSRQNVENATGINFDVLIDMDFDAVDKRIEQKIGKKLTYMRADDPRLSMRGQPYHELDRMVDMEDIDKQLLDLL